MTTLFSVPNLVLHNKVGNWAGAAMLDFKPFLIFELENKVGYLTIGLTGTVKLKNNKVGN